MEIEVLLEIRRMIHKGREKPNSKVQKEWEEERPQVFCEWAQSS